VDAASNKPAISGQVEEQGGTITHLTWALSSTTSSSANTGTGSGGRSAQGAEALLCYAVHWGEGGEGAPGAGGASVKWADQRGKGGSVQDVQESVAALLHCADRGQLAVLTASGVLLLLGRQAGAGAGWEQHSRVQLACSCTSEPGSLHAAWVSAHVLAVAGDRNGCLHCVDVTTQRSCSLPLGAAPAAAAAAPGVGGPPPDAHQAPGSAPPEGAELSRPPTDGGVGSLSGRSFEVEDESSVDAMRCIAVGAAGGDAAGGAARLAGWGRDQAPAATCLAHDGRQGLLAAGTTDGRVVVLRHVGGAADVASSWELAGSCAVGAPVTRIELAGGLGIAVSAGTASVVSFRLRAIQAQLAHGWAAVPTGVAAGGVAVSRMIGAPAAPRLLGSCLAVAGVGVAAGALLLHDGRRVEVHALAEAAGGGAEVLGRFDLPADVSEGAGGCSGSGAGGGSSGSLALHGEQVYRAAGTRIEVYSLAGEPAAGGAGGGGGC
jgi:hypothetical protein